MKFFSRLVAATALLLIATGTFAQTDPGDDDESLKMAALEALITAPAERAMPIVNKVLSGNYSRDLKERALFILSQVESPEAQSSLLAFATNGEGELQEEAIRMIGISGDDETVGRLGEIYSSGDASVREAVLEAYLIAGNSDAVYQVAVSTENDDEFKKAVELLGAMGAHDRLRELLNQSGLSEPLITAYAISGDSETLRELALDDSDPALQKRAIEALGIAGGPEVGPALLSIYRNASTDDVRAAALDGLLISGDDGAVLELYRAATDAVEKRELLQRLVMMGSDQVWDLVDNALDGSD